MKTQKEIETMQKTYDTSRKLLNLFLKYQNYDSTIEEHYDSSDLFPHKKERNMNKEVTEYKKPLFIRIINKLKSIFGKK